MAVILVYIPSFSRLHIQNRHAQPPYEITSFGKVIIGSSANSQQYLCIEHIDACISIIWWIAGSLLGARKKFVYRQYAGPRYTHFLIITHTHTALQNIIILIRTEHACRTLMKIGVKRGRTRLSFSVGCGFRMSYFPIRKKVTREGGVFKYAVWLLSSPIKASNVNHSKHIRVIR